jgi:hypothetical protein
MHQSFLVYRKSRYLWWAAAVCVAAAAAYAWHDPRTPPNGGTWLGYTLGGIGAALIFWLTALGIRKRSYRSSQGSVQGWLSAHVYLGLALLIVATLHTGFQFGWNIHTLAYILMCVVIASGVVGVVMYVRLPRAMSVNRAAQTREQMLEEIADIDTRVLRLAGRLPDFVKDALQSNRDRTALGGSVLAVLGGRDRSSVLLPAPTGGARLVPNADQGALLDWLSGELARSKDAEQSRVYHDVLSLIGARRLAVKRLRRDARIRGWLEIWLYVHVPMTVALLAALIAHVISVFLYW